MQSASLGIWSCPNQSDTGEPAPFSQALLINALLLGIFAIQHSVMARPGFKRWWTQFVPKPIERSTYVLLASLALLLLFWQWRPMADVLWNVENSAARHVLWALFFLGWVTVLVGTTLINHFDLFGLRQGFTSINKERSIPSWASGHRFFTSWCATRSCWASLSPSGPLPSHDGRTSGFAVATTAFILIAIQLEERDIVSVHGTEYEEYRKQVSALLPIPKRR